MGAIHRLRKELWGPREQSPVPRQQREVPAAQTEERLPCQVGYWTYTNSWAGQRKDHSLLPKLYEPLALVCGDTCDRTGMFSLQLW